MPCRSIEIRVDDDTAHLVLTTRDGRRADRELAKPYEVAPSVDALLIALDSRIVPDETTEPNVPLDAPETQAPPSPAFSSAPKAGTNFLLGAEGGVRWGGGLAAPTVQASAALRSGRWELGVFGLWETAYWNVGPYGGPAWSASGLGAGVCLARREPLSSSIDLVGGARVAGAVIHQETHHQHPEPEANDAEGRVGAYVGASWPRGAGFRLRTMIGGDYVPVGSSRTPVAPGAPVLPNWTATLTIGVEGEGS
jgi:hypothetical protein